MQNSLRDKINKYFETDKRVSKDSLEIITWFIYQLEDNRQHDLYLLAKILPEEYISKLVSYFSGDTIKFPTKEQYIELRLVAVCFFLKEIQGWNWDQIKTFLKVSDRQENLFSSLSFGHRINKIKEVLISDIKQVLKKCDKKDDFFILKSYVEDIKKEAKNEKRKRRRK